MANLADYEQVDGGEVSVYRNPITGVDEDHWIPDWRRRTGSDEIEKFYAGGVTEKPSVALLLKGTPTAHNDPTLPGRVKKAISAGLIGGDMAAAFLYRISKEITQTLTEDLVIDGLVIQKKGGKVSPLDFITVTETFSDEYPYDPNAVEDTLCSDLAAAFLLCMCHRLHMSTTVPNDERIERMVDRGMMIVKSSPFNAHSDVLKTAMATARNFAADLVGNAAFTALLTAIDMFFCNFPSHRYSKFRIATLHMFCKDFAVLNDIIFFRELMGMPPTEWRSWVWVNIIGAELHRIVNLNKLAKFDRSYFPYMRGLGIISRSPLSVSASPNIHAFIHAVGTLKGSERSRNAKLIGHVSDDVFINARIVSLATTVTDAKFRAAWVPKRVSAEISRAEQMLKVSAKPGGQSTAALPRTRDFMAWYLHCIQCGGTEPARSISTAKQTLHNLGRLRDASVAVALKRSTEARFIAMQLPPVVEAIETSEDEAEEEPPAQRPRVAPADTAPASDQPGSRKTPAAPLSTPRHPRGLGLRRTREADSDQD
nr:MAG: nucleocapsid [Rhabdoviridae sp.]